MPPARWHASGFQPRTLGYSSCEYAFNARHRAAAYPAGPTSSPAQDVCTSADVTDGSGLRLDGLGSTVGLSALASDGLRSCRSTPEIGFNSRVPSLPSMHYVTDKGRSPGPRAASQDHHNLRDALAAPSCEGAGSNNGADGIAQEATLAVPLALPSVRMASECAAASDFVATEMHFLDGLQLPILAGDVLVAKGEGHFHMLGATGGLMGHVLLARGPPRRVRRGTAQYRELCSVLPAASVADEVFYVPTIESTRSEKGLYRAEVLLREEATTGRLLLFGECSGKDGNEVCPTDIVAVEVWHSPLEIRPWVRDDLVHAVLEEMREWEASWSLVTAARAVLFSALRFSNDGTDMMLEELQGCWGTKPICTSVVIVFWQRLLCKAAQALEGERAALKLDPLDAMRRWMPLKADRVLPRDLVQAMHHCGWTLFTIPSSTTIGL